MLKKGDLERIENDTLAAYAMRSCETRGRDYPVKPDEFRTEFQRDRDRIIHSAAFRKLKHKTQVFLIHEGDYYRTRLTHTMEVAQIARSIAKNLALNEDLTEAIALSHDIGHTPVGHAGERVLNRLMKDEGGFDHNAQGLRVVERLEERYPDVPGLNLTWEVREGIIKHKTVYDNAPRSHFDDNQSPTLEMQIVNVADEIAFDNHDIDDALKMGMIKIADFEEVPWVWEIFQDAFKNCKGKKDKFIRFWAIRNIIYSHVSNVLAETEKRLKRFNITTVEDVRKQPEFIVSFSDEMAKKNEQLRKFLTKHVYQNYKILRMVEKYERFIESLFHQYEKNPHQLPPKYQERILTDGPKRVITDYVAGMTDLYLEEEYVRLFEPTLHAIKR